MAFESTRYVDTVTFYDGGSKTIREGRATFDGRAIFTLLLFLSKTVSYLSVPKSVLR
jgi:hypothetical protein